MRVEIFDTMEQCTDDEVSRLLPLVSEQRREQALRYRFTFGRYACLKSAVMLQGMLRESGLIGGEEKVTFEYNEYGKPSITGRAEIHFNISHCKRGIAVAVAESPVGIDIECFHEADVGLLEKTMNERERQVIVSSANPRETFTKFWTQKEALLKMRGTGIVDEIQDVLCDVDAIETHMNEDKEYAWSVINIENYGKTISNDD